LRISSNLLQTDLERSELKSIHWKLFTAYKATMSIYAEDFIATILGATLPGQAPAV
jgi:hypothetical protein